MSVKTEGAVAQNSEAILAVVPLSEADLVRVTGGGDFSDVRVHVGGAGASTSIGAAAYTPGSLISLAGNLVNLIAHEVLH